MSANSPSASTERKPLTQREIQKHLLNHLNRHRGRLILGLACGVGVGLVQWELLTTLEDFVKALNGNPNRPLLWVCVSVVLVYIALGVLKYMQSLSLATVAQYIGLEMRRDVYSHLQTLSLSFFHRRRTGSLMSTLTGDIGKLQNAAMMVKDIIATPIQALIILGKMISISPSLTLFTLIVVPFTAMAIQRLTRRLRNISQETQDRLADVAAVMEETISAPRIVRAFTAEQYEIERYENESRRAIKSQLRVVERSARLGPIVDVIGAVGIAAVLYYGGNQVMNHNMDSSKLWSYLLALSLLANYINAMGSLKSGFEEMMGAADRIFTEILNVEPEITDIPGARALPPVVGQIEFRRVEFAYVAGIPVLSGINLTIEPGQVVALVGETGAGKTTLADLVPRFYDPTAGAVLIDGFDIRTVTLSSLRKQIGIVPQDSLLFSGTIRENLMYGKRDATDEQVRAAARAANIATFIDSLPEGYETHIAERGASLSGGQQQRLCIARALLADPRILILDEATSALDAATEALVQEALETLMQGRTTIIIAHRLSTIVNADKIVVLKRGGCIAEMGTHSELMAVGGVYAALFETQRRSAEGSGTGEEGK